MVSQCFCDFIHIGAGQARFRSAAHRAESKTRGSGGVAPVRAVPLVPFPAINVPPVKQQRQQQADGNGGGATPSDIGHEGDDFRLGGDGGSQIPALARCLGWNFGLCLGRYYGRVLFIDAQPFHHDSMLPRPAVVPQNQFREINSLLARLKNHLDGNRFASSQGQLRKVRFEAKGFLGLFEPQDFKWFVPAILEAQDLAALLGDRLMLEIDQRRRMAKLGTAKWGSSAKWLSPGEKRRTLPA